MGLGYGMWLCQVKGLWRRHIDLTGWWRLRDLPSAVSVQFPFGGAMRPPSLFGLVQELWLLVRPRRKTGHGWGGCFWREEMGHCGVKVSFWRERSVTELCPRPMKSDAMEFPMSLSRWSEPLSDRAGKPSIWASRVPLAERILSPQDVNPSGLCDPPPAPLLKGHEGGLWLRFLNNPWKYTSHRLVFPSPIRPSIHKYSTGHSLPVTHAYLAGTILTMCLALCWARNMRWIQISLCLFSASGVWIQTYFLLPTCLSVPWLFSPPYLSLGCFLYLACPLLPVPIL